MAKPKVPKAKPLSIGDKLRKANPWFEDKIENLKLRALENKREKLRESGPELSLKKLKELADELEEIQRELNPKLERHEEISQQLLAHWGHTGIEEIEGSLGKTAIYPSYKISANHDNLMNGLDNTAIKDSTERRLSAEKLLYYASNVDASIQSLIIKAAKASVKISIAPPSSRRPKSGQASEEDEN